MPDPLPPSVTPSLASVVDAMCSGGFAWQEQREGCLHVLPSREALARVVDDLRAVLFPGYFGPAEPTFESRHFHVGATLDGAVRALHEQVRLGLCVSCSGPEQIHSCDERAAAVTQQFLARLVEVRRLLVLDVQAAFEGDPAAGSCDETILCYPGVLAITNHRLAHELYRLGVPLIPRMISELAHAATGIDIHPGAQVGERFFIDHGTGVVIGETSVIGARVRVYQGVTLGAKSFPTDDKGNPVKGIPRHPIVEDDVTIYANATILGRITIGRGTTVGGNVWLTRGVPANSRVAATPSRVDDFDSGAGI